MSDYSSIQLGTVVNFIASLAKLGRLDSAKFFNTSILHKVVSKSMSIYVSPSLQCLECHSTTYNCHRS